MAGAHQDQAVVLVPLRDALLEAMGQSPRSCVSPCTESNTKQSSVIPVLQQQPQSASLLQPNYA